MSKLHPVADLILDCLVSGRGPEMSFALETDAEDRIGGMMKAAIAAGDGAIAHRDALAMLGLLMKQPHAADAVDALRAILTALTANLAQARAVAAVEEKQRVEAALVTRLGRTIDRHAVPYDAPAPAGTIKGKDLCPRRRRLMR